MKSPLLHFVLSSIALIQWLSAQEIQMEETAKPGFTKPDRSFYLKGRFVYTKYCQVCHGQFGKGDGELVQGWEILPRSFDTGVFKYRSTPYGKLPTNEDLARTIRRGIAGTAMPTFSQLTDAEIRAVIEYIKFFSSQWFDEENWAAPIPIPKRPGWFDQAVEFQKKSKEGAELFQLLCASCHGPEGAGDGIAASQLVDDQNHPIRPADLGVSMRAGPDPEDVFRTITTGISGTPMPSFLEAISPSNRWEITAYVMVLRRR